MNTRQRKKQLKKNGDYIPIKELFNLYSTIAEFVIPRLKEFKKNMFYIVLTVVANLAMMLKEGDERLVKNIQKKY
jgi:hypothetical protein